MEDIEGGADAGKVESGDLDGDSGDSGNSVDSGDLCE